MPSVVCPCGKTIETKPEWAGAFIRCRGCGERIYIPHAEAGAPAAAMIPVAAPAPSGDGDSAGQPAEETRPCPYCAETIKKEAVKCRWCGQSLVQVSARPRTPVQTDTGGVGILVLAILGWVLGCFGILFLPIAWAMGASHESKCRAQGIEPSGAAKAGKILGMVGTIIYGIGVLAFVVIGIAGSLQ